MRQAQAGAAKGRRHGIVASANRGQDIHSNVVSQKNTGSQYQYTINRFVQWLDDDNTKRFMTAQNIDCDCLYDPEVTNPFHRLKGPIDHAVLETYLGHIFVHENETHLWQFQRLPVLYLHIST